MNKVLMKKWLKERDEVVKSYDVEAFKKFYHKWTRLGVYQVTLPPDKVIEISLRKMVYYMTSATPEEKAEAEKWLLDRGYDTEV